MLRQGKGRLWEMILKDIVFNASFNIGLETKKYATPPYFRILEPPLTIFLLFIYILHGLQNLRFMHMTTFLSKLSSLNHFSLLKHKRMQNAAFCK